MCKLVAIIDASGVILIKEQLFAAPCKVARGERGGSDDANDSRTLVVFYQIAIESYTTCIYCQYTSYKHCMTILDFT